MAAHLQGVVHDGLEHLAVCEVGRVQRLVGDDVVFQDLQVSEALVWEAPAYPCS
jgi:hypothetical protein